MKSGGCEWGIKSGGGERRERDFFREREGYRRSGRRGGSVGEREGNEGKRSGRESN